jgi:RNA recognition motif-containing protein
MKIFVANIPFHVADTGMRQLFELFGRVVSSKIVTQNGKSKGFGFLEMEDESQAQRAIRELDGSPIGDRNIIVRAADDQSTNNNDSTPHRRARIAFKAF